MPGGETCDDARPLEAGVLVVGSTSLARDDYRLSTATGGCRSTSGGGRDTVYRIRVAPGQVLSVGVLPTTAWNVVLNLVAGAGCGEVSVSGPTQGLACAAGADLAPAGFSESAVYTNASSQAVEVFVLIDGFGDTEAGEFGLVATLTNAAAPTGDVCANATTLPTAPVNVSLGTFANDYAGSGSANSCRFASGPDRVFSLLAQASQRVEVTVTPDSAGDVSISAIRGPASNCNGQSRCAASVNAAGVGVAERLVMNTEAADTYFFVVDSEGRTANMSSVVVSSTVGPAPVGDVCTNTAPVLTASTALSQQTLADMLNDYAFSGPGCGTAPVDGPDRVYAVAVPAGRRLRATASATGWAPTLQVLSGCHSGQSCLASGVSSATWDNTTSAPATVWVVVDSAQVTSGPFSLEMALEGLPSGLPGDTCASPGPVTTGSVVLAGQSLNGFGHHYDVTAANGCRAVAGGADRVYAVTVEAGGQVTALVNNMSSGLNVVLNLLDSACVSSSCLASADMGVGSNSETLTWANASGSSRTVFVLVSALGQTQSSGTFDVRFTLQASQAAGESCASPGAPITATTSLMGLSLAGFNANHIFDATDGCRVTSSAVDRVHQIVVPAGAEMTATVSPQGFDAVLNLTDQSTACNTTALCLDSADTSVTSPETVAFVNTGAASRTLNLVVSAFNAPSSTGSYALSVAIRPPQDRCEAPGPAVTAATTISSTWQGLSATYPFATVNLCRATAGGVDRVHAVRIPAGRQLVASLSTAVDGVLNVVAAPESVCAQNRCLTSADRGPAGAAEVASWANFGSAAQDVFVIASVYGQSTSAAGYTLGIALPLAGETCAAPAILSSLPAMVLAQSTTNHTKDHSLTTLPCRSSAGPEAVYSVVVPLGRTLAVNVSSAADVVLNLVAGGSTCASTSTCLTGANAVGAGAAETLTWANLGSSAVEVLVVVSSLSAAPMTYNLMAELR
jgi:hypothetical protein